MTNHSHHRPHLIWSRSLKWYIDEDAGQKWRKQTNPTRTSSTLLGYLPRPACGKLPRHAQGPYGEVRARNVILRLRALIRSQSSKVLGLLAVQTGMASVFALLSARWLGPSDRGVIVLVATAGTLLMLIGSAGVATGGRMLLSRNDPQYSLNQSSRVAGVFGLAQFLFVVLVGWPLLVLSDGWRGLSAGVAFALYGAAMTAMFVLREAVHGIGRHSAATFADVSMATVQAAGIIVLLVADILTVTSALWLMALSAVAEAAYLSIVVAGDARPSATDFSMPIKQLIILSAPALVASFGLAFVIRGDRLILGILSDSRSVGIYGTAATITETTWLVALGVGQVAFRHAGQGHTDHVAKLRRVNLLLSISMVAVLSTLAYPLVSLLLGPSYRDAVPLIWTLLAASIFMCSFLFDAAVLNGAGDLKGPAKAGAIGSAILMAGCFALIPLFGARGAALSSIFAYAAMALVVSRRAPHLQAQGL